MPKRQLRIDSMIIAIAIIKEEDMIITHNVDKFRALARGKIPVEPIPEKPEQNRLGFIE